MTIRFTFKAQKDIQLIYDHIAAENPSAASRVVSAIETATRRLSTFPRSGRAGAVETTRELIVQRLPYIVVYRINGDIIEIIGVFHAARDLPRG